MKTKYECEFCQSDFVDMDVCKEHERLCYHNPSSKSCETCYHHDHVLADTGKVWNTCAVGLLKSPRWIENHATSCPKWA